MSKKINAKKIKYYEVLCSLDEKFWSTDVAERLNIDKKRARRIIRYWRNLGLVEEYARFGIWKKWKKLI